MTYASELTDIDCGESCIAIQSGHWHNLNTFSSQPGTAVQWGPGIQAIYYCCPKNREILNSVLCQPATASLHSILTTNLRSLL